MRTPHATHRKPSPFPVLWPIAVRIRIAEPHRPPKSRYPFLSRDYKKSKIFCLSAFCLERSGSWSTRDPNPCASYARGRLGDIPDAATPLQKAEVHMRFRGSHTNRANNIVEVIPSTVLGIRHLSSSLLPRSPPPSLRGPTQPRRPSERALLCAYNASNDVSIPQTFLSSCKTCMVGVGRGGPPHSVRRVRAELDGNFISAGL